MFKKILREIIKEFKYSLIGAVFRRSESKQIIIQDAERWIDPYKLKKRLPENFTVHDLLFYLFNIYAEFRNLFYNRLRNELRKDYFLLFLLKRIYPERDSVNLQAGEIGPGFFIQHGNCLSLGAEKIGKNCWVNQQVTIGYSGKGKHPIIGNNVVIRPGAKIFGKITIGDNCVIGANSVVLKDVPPNCTVVGRPARIIWRDGKRVNEKL